MHALVLVDADPTQHEKLVYSMQNRKYNFAVNRDGYNIPHISEVKLYNIRAKKEIMPFIMKDLGVGNFNNPNEKVRLWDVLKGKKVPDKPGCFAEGRGETFLKYMVKKVCKFFNIIPLEVADRARIKFVDGWTYGYAIGGIKDIERVDGEEL